MEEGADVDEGGALVSAAYFGRWDVVDYLLEKGAEMDTTAYIENPYREDLSGYFNPLHAAATENQYSIEEIFRDDAAAEGNGGRWLVGTTGFEGDAGEAWLDSSAGDRCIGRRCAPLEGHRIEHGE